MEPDATRRVSEHFASLSEDFLLVQKLNPLHLSSEAVEEFLGQETVPVRRWLRLVSWESKLLWHLSGSSIAESIFNFMLSLVTQIFNGHLGTLELISCLEIWFNKGLVLISGLLPNPTTSLDSISICVRVGNELGAGNPKVARFSVIVVNATSILISIILSAFVLICRTTLNRAFTSDDAVINADSDLTPLLAVSVFLNGIQLILSGVAIGSGWQALVAYVNLSSYYIIGLPIGCILGLKKGLGVKGILWGMIFGVFHQTVTLIILTARTNWNKEVENAERLKISTDEETLDLVENIA